MRGLFAIVCLGACSLQPPPAIDPTTQAPAAAPEEPPTSEASPTPEASPEEAAAEPKPQTEDEAKLEQMMADPECLVEVVAVLKSARGLWSDTKKYTCTYEVIVNGQRYKYTRQLPKDRRKEPDEICEKGLDTTDVAVRDATHECKDLQAGARPITGLVPIR